MSVPTAHFAPDTQAPLSAPPDANRFAVLAARSCQAPTAMVVVLENGQVVFSAGTGFSAAEREGLVTLCAATLENPSRQPLLPARCAPGIQFFRGLPLSDRAGN